MDGHILLATDGRTRSELASEYAIALGRLLDAPIEALYVIDERLLEAVEDDGTREELAADLRSLGESVLEDVTAQADGVSVTTSVDQGVPHRVILDATDEAGLLVLGRTISEPTDPATVAGRVTGATDIPVLSVPTGAANPPTQGFESVIVPTDGSDYPDRALETVLEWMAPEAIVHGVYVVDADIYDLADAPRSVIGILREGGESALADLANVADGHTVRRHIRRGRVTPTILEAITDLEPDIVAIGSRGRSADNDPILGSTTRSLLRQATLPVLVSP